MISENFQTLFLSDDEKSALRAMVECVNMSKDKERICYMYKRDGKGFWGLSFEYWDNWLFKAYPGGRKMLSLTGKKYMQDHDLAGVLAYLENLSHAKTSHPLI